MIVAIFYGWGEGSELDGGDAFSSIRQEISALVLLVRRINYKKQKRFNILKPGEQLISLVGPPAPEFAEEIGLPWYLKLVTKLLSSGAKKKAKKINTRFLFLFMRAEGSQLGKITSLIEAGVIKPTGSFEKTSFTLQATI
ncbi:hypothetical protein Q4E93_18255 [Flavitalea sp. BT771]|uniref:hypothetical protein n=1 Tax=Flavitalea sp. BT771 TaxID=3063329 RepID=UPI0026E40D64|nr:hypothetical protein [Flavitalea sp. BT771]MDO6432554.1 hypothetical protein [Flavitalea sp. BT771]MDV6221463.1 hypothetical protein [Flavitalea sp. BT771]